MRAPDDGILLHFSKDDVRRGSTPFDTVASSMFDRRIFHTRYMRVTSFSRRLCISLRITIRGSPGTHARQLRAYLDAKHFI